MFQNPDDVTVMVAISGFVLIVASNVITSAVQLWQQGRHLAADRRRIRIEFLVNTFDALWAIYDKRPADWNTWNSFKAKAASINDPTIQDMLRKKRENPSEGFQEILERIGQLIAEEQK